MTKKLVRRTQLVTLSIQILNFIGEEQRADHGLDLSGQRVAHLFAEKARQTLDTADFEKLQDFLGTPPETYEIEDLHRLRIFHAAGLLESGEPWNKLVGPSGPEKAQLGLVMHCQSKEGGIRDFWDIESRSIQTLAEKGRSEEFMFSFDWHWRAEIPARGRGPCPATQRTKTVRDLHHVLSCSLLEKLPLRLLIIAGSCPKEQYSKNISNRAKKIELSLTPNLIIEFDLDFRSDGLRHITVYMDHPSASFSRPNSSV